MLKQPQTARWRMTFYLITFPLLLLTALFSSSWVFSDINDLESTLDKKYTLFSDQSIKSDLIFEWGHFKREIPLLPLYNEHGESAGQLTYRWHEKIGKQKILSLINKPISLNSKTSSSFVLEQVELHVNQSGATNKIASLIPGDLQYLDTSFRNLIAENKNLILYFTGKVDSKPVHISFHLLDFTDKADYLKWGDLQFDIYGAYGPPLPVQVVTWETMAELTQRSYELFKNGQSNGSYFGTLLVKDGTSTVIVPPILSQKIRIDQAIKNPIILQITGADGRLYSAVFDDEPNPKLHYETWDELCYDYIFIENAKVEVDEAIWQFSWGPLQASRPPTTYNLMFDHLPYFTFDTRFAGIEGYQGSASATQLKKMITSPVRLKIKDGNEFERIEIELNHIKSQGLPTSYFLKFEDGRLINSQDASLLTQELQEGDFLDISRIAPPGQTKGIRFYIKAL